MKWHVDLAPGPDWSVVMLVRDGVVVSVTNIERKQTEAAS